MPQLARWRMRLESFDFDVHYRCGALQQVADGLSRSACDDDGIDAVAVHYRDVLPECSLERVVDNFTDDFTVTFTLQPVGWGCYVTNFGLQGGDVT